MRKVLPLSIGAFLIFALFLQTPPPIEQKMRARVDGPGVAARDYAIANPMTVPSTTTTTSRSATFSSSTNAKGQTTYSYRGPQTTTRSQ